MASCSSIADPWFVFQLPEIDLRLNMEINTRELNQCTRQPNDAATVSDYFSTQRRGASELGLTGMSSSSVINTLDSQSFRQIKMGIESIQIVSGFCVVIPSQKRVV